MSESVRSVSLRFAALSPSHAPKCATSKVARPTFGSIRDAVLLLTLLLGLFLPQLGQSIPAADESQSVQQAVSRGGMVVSASPFASEVGKTILDAGGSAVDAAVAVAMTLAVTWPEAGNIGGGGFMMVHRSDGSPPICIDYREAAPLSATADMFSREDSTLSAKAAGVPGTVDGLWLAHQRDGRLPWRDLVVPAVQLASDGFVIDTHLASSLNGVLGRSAVRDSPQLAEFRRVYGKPDGTEWREGDRLTQADLAMTLRHIADAGPDGFYRGVVADKIVAEMGEWEGRITHRDLAEYEALVREPIRGSYRGHEVWGPPPPSSGGISLALMLRMLEPFSLSDRDRHDPDNLHLLAEVMRRAYAERARHLGDPAFAPIPRQLVSPEFARRLTSSISLDRATPSDQLVPEISVVNESESTTHFSVMDAEGMAVSNTYTLEASFGSCVVVRGAGFLLNNEMGDFNWIPGVTSRSGRIGTTPNLVAPRKRMLSSQTPVIVTRDGKTLLITGSPGGRTIINTVLGIVLNVLEFEMELADAVEAPRFHHQWFPDELVLEPGNWVELESLQERLQSLGHTVRVRSGNQGAAHSIYVDHSTGNRVGVADWRRGGKAIGVDRIE